MAMSSRSPAAVVGEGNAKMTARKWVGWEEEDGEEQSKVCYYYLRCAPPQGGGESERDLAVVGKDWGLGNIAYTAHPKFLVSLENALNTAPKSSRVATVAAEVTELRWMSRKEVMDWLTSLVSDPPYGAFGLASPGDHDGSSPASKDTLSTRVAAVENKEGFTWLCKLPHLDQRRRHYRSFYREGMRIAVHDFVYIKSEGGEGHVAYVEDMYEDVSARKMVLARWFEKADDDHGPMLPDDVHNREVFFSYVLQDLRVESVVGLAAVLNSQHFEMFQKSEEGSNWQPYLCHRQIEDNTVGPFDMTQLQGYENQEIVRAIVKASSSTTVHAKQPNKAKTANTITAVENHGSSNTVIGDETNHDSSSLVIGDETNHGSSSTVINDETNHGSSSTVIGDKTNHGSSSIIGDKTNHGSSDTVIGDKTNHDSSSTVIGDKTNHGSSCTVMDDKTNHGSSGIVISDKTNHGSSNTVIGDKTNHGSSSTVMDDKSNHGSSGTVISGKTMQKQKQKLKQKPPPCSTTTVAPHSSVTNDQTVESNMVSCQAVQNEQPPSSNAAANLEATTVKKRHLSGGFGSGSGLHAIVLPIESDDEPMFQPGCHIEVLCQDSSVRGCWFRCVVLKTRRHDEVQVRYLDIQNAEDTGNLMEWLKLTRTAERDILGIRLTKRMMIRPHFPPKYACYRELESPVAFGVVVDAKKDDRWWEGIVLGQDTEGGVKVYLQGERQQRVFKVGDLRQSIEWHEGKWKYLEQRIDVASRFVSTSKTKLAKQIAGEKQEKHRPTAPNRILDMIKGVELEQSAKPVAPLKKRGLMDSLQSSKKVAEFAALSPRLKPRDWFAKTGPPRKRFLGCYSLEEARLKDRKNKDPDEHANPAAEMVSLQQHCEKGDSSTDAKRRRVELTNFISMKPAELKAGKSSGGKGSSEGSRQGGISESASNGGAAAAVNSGPAEGLCITNKEAPVLAVTEQDVIDLSMHD